MNTQNIKRAFKYRFFDSIKGAAVFFAIIAAVIVFFMANTYIKTQQGVAFQNMFSGGSFSAAITLFVFGICTIREDLRLMMQNGLARRTVFAVEILNSVALSFAVAVGCELIVLAGQLITNYLPNFLLVDLYQLFYLYDSFFAMTVFEHIKSIVLTTGFLICANCGGIFISLLFYRLNKVATVMVAVGGPIVLLNGLSELVFRNDPWLQALINFVGHSVWNLSLVFLLAAAVAAVAGWLLLRRAPVKAVK